MQLIYILLVLLLFINFISLRPAVDGQKNQFLFWLLTSVTLISTCTVIVLPIYFWPFKALAQLTSIGFSTWLITATITNVVNFKWRRQPPSGHIDYILILGAHVTATDLSPVLKRRMNLALTILAGQPQAKLILSGGQGDNEPISEAQAMAKYVNQRIPSYHRFLLETKSISTLTNLINSKLLIKRDWHTATHPHVLIVTSDYHIARTRLLAAKLHFTVQTASVVTSTSSLYQATMREIAAILILIKWPLIACWLISTLIAQLIISFL